ncbi:hypothetical protein BJ742DRAFT_830963 [Cladochytrium replicatum]|nr:hypothetical protein BJ742DRAFT_830963 [Cladochytrium replicatum]
MDSKTVTSVPATGWTPGWAIWRLASWVFPQDEPKASSPNHVRPHKKSRTEISINTDAICEVSKAPSSSDSTNNLRKLSPELLLAIMELLPSVQDIIALSSTCKYHQNLHNILLSERFWVRRRDTILYPVVVRGEDGHDEFWERMPAIVRDKYAKYALVPTPRLEAKPANTKKRKSPPMTREELRRIRRENYRRPRPPLGPPPPMMIQAMLAERLVRTVDRATDRLHELYETMILDSRSGWFLRSSKNRGKHGKNACDESMDKIRRFEMDSGVPGGHSMFTPLPSVLNTWGGSPSTPSATTAAASDTPTNLPSPLSSGSSSSSSSSNSNSNNQSNQASSSSSTAQNLNNLTHTLNQSWQSLTNNTHPIPVFIPPRQPRLIIPLDYCRFWLRAARYTWPDQYLLDSNCPPLYAFAVPFHLLPSRLRISWSAQIMHSRSIQVGEVEGIDYIILNCTRRNVYQQDNTSRRSNGNLDGFLDDFSLIWERRHGFQDDPDMYGRLTIDDSDLDLLRQYDRAPVESVSPTFSDLLVVAVEYYERYVRETNTRNGKAKKYDYSNRILPRLGRAMQMQALDFGNDVWDWTTRSVGREPQPECERLRCWVTNQLCWQLDDAAAKSKEKKVSVLTTDRFKFDESYDDDEEEDEDC